MQRYENIFGLDRDNIVRKAERAMREGWTADFFDPARAGDETLWLIADQSRRSQNYHAHGWEMLDLPLAAFSETGETRFLDAAMTVALDWVRLFSNEEERAAPIGEDHMAWYDMAVGLRAFRMAYLIEAAERAGRHEAGEVDALWESLLLHADYLTDDANFRGHNNHGFYQAAGQLAMGRRFAERDPVMEAARAQGAARFDAMLHQQFSEEGVHLEHSPDYHRMVYLTARAMADAGFVEAEETIAFLDRIERALSWFILPSGHIANVGDSDSHLLHLKPEDAVAKWRTPEMRYVVSVGKEGTQPEGSTRFFTGAGYAVARFGQADPTQASYLLMQAGFHSRTHKHADTLSFLWSDRGHRILVDAGRYGYIGKTAPGSELHKQGYWYSDPYRMYCESTRAHNCLEFDGENYPRKGVDPFGSALERIGEIEELGLVAFAAAAEHEKGLEHRRLLLMKAGEWLICLDRYEDRAKRRREARQWFHFGPGIEVSQRGDHAFTVDLTFEDEPLQVCSLVGEVEDALHIKGQMEPEIQGWWSRANRKIEPNDAIAFQLGKARSQVAATLFQFGREVGPGESTIAPDASSGQLVWDSDGKRYRLAFRQGGDGRLEIDYDVA